MSEAKTKYHFIGIGGIGMSGLARILLSKNQEVSGSDRAASYVTESLEKAGAKIMIGHAPQRITEGMTVIYSTDIKTDNPELQDVKRLKVPLLHRSDLLQQLMQDHKTLAVAGSHGKTTTTALLAAVLMHAQKNPSFMVGGIVSQYETNAHHGSGEYFVAEADESDGSFLKYSPLGAIVTNIDLEHMNHYQTEERLSACFKSFIETVKDPKYLFWSGDCERLVSLNPLGISYGFSDNCLLQGRNFRQAGWGITFDAEFNGINYHNIELPLVGKHNAKNALAVFGLSLSLGIDEEAIREAFKTFRGVGRRCEKKGVFQEILFLDDYGHHPTEIRVTLRAIREAVRERRLIAVFQPHRYSRMRHCMDELAAVFNAADEVILTDIFSAGEEAVPRVTIEEIKRRIGINCTASCRYVPRNDLGEFLADYVLSHDVVVTFGAGDITKIGPDVLQKLQTRAPKKLKVGVVFGGRSCEHEISILSARHVHSSLDPALYEVQDFGIDKRGRWITEPDLLSKTKETVEACKAGANDAAVSAKVLAKLIECDVLIPVLHGTYGEDGTIQGFFEILGKAYVGCDHRSAAICMDKAATKKLMELHGIPTLPFVDFSEHQWENHSEEILNRIQAKLTLPLFVKPVHLGSAIGVKRVENERELKAAIAHAFTFDRTILVENGVQAREIEFAVLGNDWVRVFPPGEIPTHGSCYDYEAKYGANAIKAIPKADLSPSLLEKGMHLAEKAYLAAGCSGLARVDFFLDHEGDFWLNEINPFPGFTKISLYPQICAVNGLPSSSLMDQFIILALQRKRVEKV
jgi:UDP-N-acetylmuramate--alanine ligase